MPCVQILAGKLDVIILSETWLWPYELKKRMWWGSILWNECLPVTSAVSMDSDRIFAIHLTISNYLSLSIIGVYLLTTEHPVDTQ